MNLVKLIINRFPNTKAEKVLLRNLRPPNSYYRLKEVSWKKGWGEEEVEYWWAMTATAGKAVFSNKVKASLLPDKAWNILSHLQTLSCTFPIPSTNELHKLNNDQNSHFPSLFPSHSKSLSSLCVHTRTWHKPPGPSTLTNYRKHSKMMETASGVLFWKKSLKPRTLWTLSAEVLQKKFLPKKKKLSKPQYFGETLNKL